jgi:hypothetical protein
MEAESTVTRTTGVGVLAVVLAASIAPGVSGSATVPPNAFTGAPGEQTCALCHGNLNVGDGSIIITAPDTYIPGVWIDLTVQVAMDGQSRWGFELTVLDANDLPVGNIIETDPVHTQYSFDSTTGREYLKHTEAGTYDGWSDVSPGWEFTWVSPGNEARPVTFYIVGNAANGSGFPDGDYVYTQTLTYQDTGVDDKRTWGMIKALYR